MKCRVATAMAALLLTFALSGCAGRVLVEWTTETELDTAGFNLYRSEALSGPFEEKINDALIPASPDPLAGGSYSYIDRNAIPGVTYYYELQEVEQNGQVNKFGPINARASGFRWEQALVLGGLAVVVLLLWLRGGRRT